MRARVATAIALLVSTSGALAGCGVSVTCDDLAGQVAEQAADVKATGADLGYGPMKMRQSDMDDWVAAAEEQCGKAAVAKAFVDAKVERKG